jgi:hypothetical protein
MSREPGEARAPIGSEAPAPFRVERIDRKPHLYRVVDDEENTVCLVPGRPDFDSGVRAYRLAQLFASAPDLFEALADLISCAETLEEFEEPGGDFWLSLQEANAALRRAEGVDG